MKRRYGEPTGAGTTAGRSLAEEMASLCHKKSLACQKINLFPAHMPPNSPARDSAIAQHARFYSCGTPYEKGDAFCLYCV